MIHEVVDIITKESPHLDWMQDRTILLVRHGSCAYGTNVEGSDEDFKGVAIPPLNYFLGFQHTFEQATLKAPNPDTSIYNINKFFSLASLCNPNVLEILYTEPEDHIFISPLGQQIIDNRDLFLSKQVKHTMCGYAYDQMYRIKLHMKWITSPPKELVSRSDFGLPEQAVISEEQYLAAKSDIDKELQKYQFDFLDDCSEPTKIAIKNAWRELLIELRITTEDQWLSAARTIGLNDNFIEIMQKERAYRNKKEEWKKFLKWKAKRNPARYALEEKYGYDTKHGYHLVRLLRMCREILTTGKVIVKRRHDREELLEIRNGSWSFDKLKDFTTKEELELQELYKTTTLLPRSPNLKKLDPLCISIIEQSFK
jgi:predicted nucleotidyltransferase